MPRGPYGTNEGDVWLGGGAVADMLEERDGLTMIHEMMMKDGEVQECVYATDNQKMIDEATIGHALWVAAQAFNN